MADSVVISRAMSTRKPAATPRKAPSQKSKKSKMLPPKPARNRKAEKEYPTLYKAKSPPSTLVSLQSVDEHKKFIVDSKENTKESTAELRVSKTVLMPPTKKLEFIDPSEAPGAKEIEDEVFYHGYMERAEAELLLQVEGQFLIRKTEYKKRKSFVLSLYHDGRISHYPIQRTPDGLYYSHKYSFKSVSQLVRWHQRMRVPINKSNIMIGTAVEREDWQLYHEQVTLGKELGRGEFGEVFDGKFTVGVFSSKIEVAVKTLNKNHMSRDDTITFLREANVMRKLHHRNIVEMYGVCTQKEPIMIVMEMAPGGSLLKRVKTKPPLKLEIKRRYVSEILNGMSYLEEQHIIHRDLAARNVLLDKKDECKISDFGLSIFCALQRKETKLTKVPVRWLSPETLTTGVYSKKSDVWSYGVTIWEVYSNGEQPYSHLKNPLEVSSAVTKKHLRLTPPKDIPDGDAEYMQLCWTDDAMQRPSFKELKSKYKSLVSTKFLDKLFHAKGASENGELF